MGSRETCCSLTPATDASGMLCCSAGTSFSQLGIRARGRCSLHRFQLPSNPAHLEGGDPLGSVPMLTFWFSIWPERGRGSKETDPWGEISPQGQIASFRSSGIYA